MIYKIIIIIAIIGALDGCSLIQPKVEIDPAAAAAIAANAGDTAGTACFNALEQIVGTASTGLLSKFEAVRAGRIAVEDGPCAPLAAELLLHLLNKLPGVP